LVGCARGQHTWDLQLYSVRVSAHIRNCGNPGLTLMLTSFSVPELVKTNGQIVILSSMSAQLRVPCFSDYCVSKHALHCLAECVVTGKFSYFEVSLRASSTRNCLKRPSLSLSFPRTQSAATILYLTSGKADYLSCRYISVTWDLGEIERDWKGKDSHPKCPRQQTYFPSVDPGFLKFNPSCDHGEKSCHMHG
jgi:hypothetical protein